MNEQTRTLEVVLMKPLWNLLYMITAFAFLGIQLLFYFRGSWFPFWVKISVTVLFVLVWVAFLTHFTIVISRKGLPSLREVAFKPFWFWYLLLGSIGVTVLSWGVALIFYNLWWFLLALGTTMFMGGCCWVGIKRAVKQLEPSSDIV